MALSRKDPDITESHADHSVHLKDRSELSIGQQRRHEH